ncbi:hypothetical protein ISG33_12370 [Glaciecola sp. MH2013]|uniref:hypothetical protein n=1 Tax=Glaciecola sp. MH2013 TaxID=2785524 RepID=UPI0018A07BD9|nr:hypothetical protein [Glaciecola sp. MH2013]MBF7074196.1 hypothetical protein [Glaciecola sp. MH2013]
MFIKMLLAAFVLFAFGIASAAFDDDFIRKATEIGDALESSSNNELAVILEAEKLQEKYKEDSQALQILSQYTATYYSIVADHKNALIAADTNASIPKDETFEISGYFQTDAIQTILNRSDETQVVMINEAHHIAQHRVLSIRLLKGLYNKGFRFLALEGMGSYIYPYSPPLLDNHGYYTNEPVFSMLIKTAEEMGFEIVSYDGASSTIKMREHLSAKNLKARIFDKNSKAKVLIHVGYSHINEDTWLAAEINDLLDINPLTVSQTKIREKSHTKFEVALYDVLLAKKQSDEPFVLINQNQEIWSSNPEKWDIDVIWPRTIYSNDKPKWMTLGREQIKIPNLLCNNTYPCFVEVFHGRVAPNRDIESLTAHDKTIVRDSKNVSTILLMHGENTILAKDANNMVINRIEGSFKKLKEM